MRRFAELLTVAATALILVATSQARSPCAIETRVFSAESTCGPPAVLAVTSTTTCQITVIGAEAAGLPNQGSIKGYGADAGVLTGFHLAGVTPDGGNVRNCEITPGGDAGFALLCIPTCDSSARVECEPSCSGTLRLHYQIR